jgi:hypothetical protein
MNLSQIKKLLKYVFSAKLLEDEINLTKSARMTEEEVIEVTKNYVQELIPSDEVGRYIGLKEVKKKLVWSVRYAPISEDGLPCKSGHTILYIDDETGKLVKKIISPY